MNLCIRSTIPATFPCCSFGTGGQRQGKPRPGTGARPLSAAAAGGLFAAHRPRGIGPPASPAAVRDTLALTWQHPEPPEHPSPERPRAPAPHGASSVSGRKATGLQLSLSQGSAQRVAPAVSTPPGGGDRDTTCPAWGTDVSVSSQRELRWQRPNSEDPLMLRATPIVPWEALGSFPG